MYIDKVMLGVFGTEVPIVFFADDVNATLVGGVIHVIYLRSTHKTDFQQEEVLEFCTHASIIVRASLTL